MKKILLTGSQGFIGSYICNELLSKGYKVVGVDNFQKYGKVTRAHDTHPNFKLYNIDVLSDNFLEIVDLEKPNMIIAGAAMIGGISYFHKFAYDLLATNERILAQTFDAAILAHKKGYLERIIVLSSSMVFEEALVYPTPESAIKNTPPPSSTYGFQKLASEYFAKGAWEQYQLPYSIIRPFNCVGIGEDDSIMKITAVIVSRNDNYGGHLNERATYCINSAIDTYDEVIYVDWNSPEYSLLYDIKDNLQLKGNLKHFVITPEVASILTNNDPQAQKCCEVLARNIGIRRATGDFIISTNIDIIHPKREDVEKVINDSDNNTMITLSRRETTWDIIKEFHGGELKYNEWDKLRDYIYINSEERKHEEKTVSSDDYSIINCCGDFQLAPKHVWDSIRGFEEELIYPLFADTNVQKKSIMHGHGLKAIYNPPMFHINHGSKGWGGGGIADGINKKSNDQYRAVVHQQLTENTDSWGFGETEIEFEII
jgi:hypothetical protein